MSITFAAQGGAGPFIQKMNRLIGRVWILSACLVWGALGLLVASSGWGVNDVGDKVQGEEQGGDDCGHGLELQPTPRFTQPALCSPFRWPEKRRTGHCCVFAAKASVQTLLSTVQAKRGGKRGFFPHFPTPAWVPLKSWPALLPFASAKLIANYQKSIKPSFSWGRKL